MNHPKAEMLQVKHNIYSNFKPGFNLLLLVREISGKEQTSNHSSNHRTYSERLMKSVSFTGYGIPIGDMLLASPVMNSSALGHVWEELW